MAQKVTFDTTNKIIQVSASPVDQQVELDVLVDLYSDAKEDWLATPTLQVMRFPIRPIGGDIVSIGQLGATYLLDYGWRIDPNLDQKIFVGQTTIGEIAVKGTTGTEAQVAQSGQMPVEGRIESFHVRVRSVGTPTDSLRAWLSTTPGGTVISEAQLDGDLITGVMPTGKGYYMPFETPALLMTGTTFYLNFGRTGARDAVNYYEVAYDNDVFGGPTYSAWIDGGSWAADTAKDLCVHIHIAVPYELTVTGNLFTSDGRPAVIPSEHVSVILNVSTLVEVRADASSAADLSLIRMIMTNKLVTDPTAGTMTIYADDGTTILRQWYIWEDVAESQAYRGQGIEVREPQ